MLLSGEAEAIGSKTAEFHAQISRENALLSETISISSQRDAIIRIGYVLADSKMPAPAGSDMRRLHEAASANADARLAIQMFCYSVRKHVAAMIAALDGVDLTRLSQLGRRMSDFRVFCVEKSQYNER